MAPQALLRFISLVVLISTLSARAQLLSVDINGTVRSDVSAPGFTPWYMTPDVTGGLPATRSFTNYSYTYDPDTGFPAATNVSLIITCKVTMTVPMFSDPTHYLNANYANKNGNSTSPDPNSGWRLSADGCWAHWKDDAVPAITNPATMPFSWKSGVGTVPAQFYRVKVGPPLP